MLYWEMSLDAEFAGFERRLADDLRGARSVERADFPVGRDGDRDVAVLDVVHLLIEGGFEFALDGPDHHQVDQVVVGFDADVRHLVRNDDFHGARGFDAVEIGCRNGFGDDLAAALDVFAQQGRCDAGDISGCGEARCDQDGYQQEFFHGFVFWGLIVFSVADELDLSDEFIPGFVERCEVFAAFVRERVVLAGRTLRGFLPAVGQQSGIFLPGEDRVERTLDYDHLGLLEFGDDLRSIRVLAGENGEDAVLQNSFAHLRLYVVFSHGAMRLTFWGLWERSARGDVNPERETSEEDQEQGCDAYQ